MANKHNLQLITDSLIKQLAKGGIIIFCGAMISRIIIFIFNVILARSLGVVSYGLYALGQSIHDVAISVTSLGNGKGIIRLGAVYLEKKDLPRLKGVLLSGTALSLLVSVVIAVFLFVFSRYIAVYFFKKAALTNVFRLFALSIPFYTSVVMVSVISITFHNMKYRALIQGIFHPLANLIFVSAVFILGYHLYGAITAFILSSFCCIPLGIYSVKRLFPEIFCIRGIYRIKNIISYSSPVILSTLLYFLLFSVSRIMLGIFRPVQEVAVYSAVLKCGLPIMLFSGFFTTPLYPVISTLVHTKKLELLKKIYGLISMWGGWLAFVPLLIILLFYREFLLLFGAEYLSGRDILFILSLLFFLKSLPGNLTQLLEMGGGQKLEFVNSLLAVMMNIVLCLIMVPSMGILGAAISYSVSILAVIIIQLIQVKKIFGVYPFSKRYMKFLIFAAALILITILWIKDFTFIIRTSFAVLSIFSYCIVIYLLRSKEEARIWNAVKSRIFDSKS